MTDGYQFAYLTGNLILFIIWLTLFIYRKDLRHKMLLMSCLIAPLGPLSEIFFTRDYWKPELFNGWQIGIEDLLFGFFAGGIASVFYEEILGKKYTKRHLAGHPRWMLGFVIFSFSSLILMNIIFGFNSIYISVAGFLIIGAVIIAIRHDLARVAFLSGFFAGIMALILYIIFLYLFPGVIERWWLLSNISGILILGIPFEELLWAFGWGMVVGPAYEFTTGYFYRRQNYYLRR